MTQQAVDTGVVRLAVDEADIKAVFFSADRAELPVGEMRTAKYGGFSAIAYGGYKFFPVKGNALPDAVQVRIFGGHAAQVVPHAQHDLFAFRRVFFREGKSKILPRRFCRGKMRAYMPRNPAANGGGHIQRQDAEEAIDGIGQCGFERIT
jgi:hypothetical protein